LFLRGEVVAGNEEQWLENGVGNNDVAGVGAF
jgi:hypothetical protein